MADYPFQRDLYKIVIEMTESNERHEKLITAPDFIAAVKYAEGSILGSDGCMEVVCVTKVDAVLNDFYENVEARIEEKWLKRLKERENKISE